MFVSASTHTAMKGFAFPHHYSEHRPRNAFFRSPLVFSNVMGNMISNDKKMCTALIPTDIYLSIILLNVSRTKELCRFFWYLWNMFFAGRLIVASITRENVFLLSWSALVALKVLVDFLRLCWYLFHPFPSSSSSPPQWWEAEKCAVIIQNTHIHCLTF